MRSLVEALCDNALTSALRSLVEVLLVVILFLFAAMQWECMAMSTIHCTHSVHHQSWSILP